MRICPILQFFCSDFTAFVIIYCVMVLMLLSVVSETQSLASAQVLEDQEKAVEEMKKDASELGIEVIDQISALAG